MKSNFKAGKHAKLKIEGLKGTGTEIQHKMLDCMITNDNHGKTLTIGDDKVNFTIAFEQIEKHLK